MKRVNLLGMSLRSVNLGLLLALTAGACELSATTLVVGSCQPKGYSTIQAAINAAPAGATVKVCPGAYFEQVTITRALTLEGIPSTDSNYVLLFPPSNGLTQTAPTDIPGYTVAYQVWVNNSQGPVNISNIILDGSGNLVSACPPDIAGIFYQNSPGTINEVYVTYEYGNGCGLGIWVEGGSSNPSVTVENSVVFSFDYLGIFAETTNQANTELTAKITSNTADPYWSGCFAGIVVESGTTSTVTKNVLSDTPGDPPTPCQYGIFIAPYAAGSVSGNTVRGYANGIGANADDVPVTSNTLVGAGINVQTAVAAIKQNSITVAGKGIEFNCLANPNVLSNTISAPNIGLDRVPSALGTATNRVFNAGAIRIGGC